MTDQETSELGQAIQEVSEKASLLVREEIALARAELTEKLTGIAKGAAVGAAAGVFVLAGLIYFLHLDGSSAQRWNVMAFLFTLLILAIVVVGSLWVMHNMNANMMTM